MLLGIASLTNKLVNDLIINFFVYLRQILSLVLMMNSPSVLIPAFKNYF